VSEAKAARAWASPGGRAAVVLGRSQRPPAVPWSAPFPLPVRRRASGGGAVLAGPWLLCALVRLPRDHPLAQHGPAVLARWLGSVHLQWMRQRGFEGAALHAGPHRDHWACFAGLSPGEVTLGARKLTGIAQAWRRSGVVAGAGTLLYAPPWSLLCEALQRPLSDAVELAATTASLSECCERQPPAAALARSLQVMLQSALRDHAQAGPETAGPSRERARMDEALPSLPAPRPPR